ncbi:MAG: hypothetical protein HY749_04205 [Gammaproteobacteria bacterium]|nr:hypothetical protein [Gammaproteobacteria bacterium]MBI5614973.1 hypothetical protein [Gammaproteobacteria bacterium]
MGILLIAVALGAHAAGRPKAKRDLVPRDADGAPCVTGKVLTAADRCAHQTVDVDKSHCHADTKYSVEFTNRCDTTVYVTYHLDGTRPESERRGAAVVKAKSTQIGSLVLLKTRDGTSGQLVVDRMIGQ